MSAIDDLIERAIRTEALPLEEIQQFVEDRGNFLENSNPSQTPTMVERLGSVEDRTEVLDDTIGEILEVIIPSMM